MRLFGPPNIEKLERTRNAKGLARALGHKDGEVRAAAAAALAAVGTRDARDALAAAAESDADEEVRLAAAHGLAQLGDGRAIRALGHIRAAGAFDALVALAEREGKLAPAAVNELGSLGDRRAVEPLLRLLDRPGSPLPSVIEALGKLGDRRAVEPFLSLLHGEGEARAAAAEALGALGDARAVEPLIAVLHVADHGTHVTAATALGKLRDPRAVPPLLGALQAAEAPTLQQAAATALGEIHDERAVEPLIALVEDADAAEPARKSALDALHQIASPRAKEFRDRVTAAERARRRRDRPLLDERRAPKRRALETFTVDRHALQDLSGDVGIEAVAEMVRRGSVQGLFSLFNRAADWPTREWVMVGFQQLFRTWHADPAVRSSLQSTLPKLLELCRAESSGASYRTNCIDAAEGLLRRLS